MNPQNVERSMKHKYSRFDYYLSLFGKPRLFMMEAMYQIHLRLRHPHDSLYQKSEAYRKYSDSLVIKYVRRAILVAFCISLVLIILK